MVNNEPLQNWIIFELSNPLKLLSSIMLRLAQLMAITLASKL